MEAYKKEFISFMVDCQALKFGDFTLKSGRKSPFFMNAGAYVTGSQLMKLGEYYAKAIHDTYGDDFDVLFGPAYKGIPIRLIGVRVDGLSKKDEIQMSLFDNKQNEKQERIDFVLDKIKDKYGYNAITRAGKIDLEEMPDKLK